MADPHVTSARGWSQLAHTLSKKMPGRLHAASRARRGIRALMRGNGRA